MSDVFISYARSSEAIARQVQQALREAGYAVWRDDELPAHRIYAEVIEERLRAAKAVLVLWSSEALASQWVRAEADAARGLGTLVQASVDGTLPPIPFNQMQCANLQGWDGEDGHSGWRKVKASVKALAAGSEEVPPSPSPQREKKSVCVLPFANMSSDAEQDYFSDGITDDITTDLSKVSALEVISRSIAFMFRGKSVNSSEVATKLGVSHVLEGSVRKAGNRVRITAQLIEGATGAHVWADRYDRDLNDIFAVQDELSKAIVAALKVKLLPQEKKAIEARGTYSAEAYTLYLMARQYWISGNVGDTRREEVVIRICRKTTAIDPNYAKAWALLALAQAELRFLHGRPVDALSAADRALEIDPKIPEARCVKARYLQNEGRLEDANRQIEIALHLEPDSWEVNKEAGHLTFRQGRTTDAIPYFEKAASLVDTDYDDAGMLVTCYQAIGDAEGVRRAAETTLARAQQAIEHDPHNGFALAWGAASLAALGESERAKEWIDRAMLIDPDNIEMRYNLSCALVTHLGDHETALELLAPYFEQASIMQITHLTVDPDLAPLSDHPRFREMLARANARLASRRKADTC